MLTFPHRVILLVLIAYGAMAGAHAQAAVVSPPSASEAAVMPTSVYGLHFEPARSDDSGRTFIARSRDHAARITPDALYVHARDRRTGWSMHLVQAAADAEAQGLHARPGRSHYYRGNDPAAWVSAPHFGAILYRNVYPGIDVVWQHNDGRLQYDFHLAPGADPGRIRFAFDQLDAVELEDNGALRLSAAHGSASLARPWAWQDIAGERHPVPVAFALLEDDSVGFHLGPWDPTHPLVIDPVVSYASYLGGDGSDEAVAMATDANGNIYIAGTTDSLEIFAPGAATPSRPRTASSGVDVFVARLAPDGELDYITYLSGEAEDRARALTVDPSGSVFLAGITASADFPLLNSLGGQTGLYSGGDADGFVARLDATGAMAWSAYLGGQRADNANAIALDAELNVYIAGSTTSDDFAPVAMTLADESLPNPVQPARSPGPNESGCGPAQLDCIPADGFVVKASAGGELLYATYLGGSGPDGIFGIAARSDGRLVVGGGTGSLDLPGVSFEHSYQSALSMGGAGGAAIDGFVAMLSDDGSSIDEATYLGGVALDRILALALDADGDVYVTGLTSSRRDTTTTPTGTSTGFPVTDNSVHRGGDFDAFVSRLRFNSDDVSGSQGSSLIYSSYLGGDGDDQGLALAIDDQRRVIVVGETDSDDFPADQAWQPGRIGAADGFVAVFDMGDDDTAASRRIASYMGGSDLDRLTAVALAADGRIHVAGVTRSLDAPLVSPFQESRAAATDAFVASIDLDVPVSGLPDLRVRIGSDPMPVPQNDTLVYTLEIANVGNGGASGVLVTLNADNATLVASDACAPHGEQRLELLCGMGNLAAGDTQNLTVTARPQRMGNAVLRAAVVRADQSDVQPGNNSAQQTRLIVDNSGGRAALSWPVLLTLLPGLLFLRARSRRRRCT